MDLIRTDSTYQCLAFRVTTELFIAIVISSEKANVVYVHVCELYGKVVQRHSKRNEALLLVAPCSRIFFFFFIFCSVKRSDDDFGK